MEKLEKLNLTNLTPDQKRTFHGGIITVRLKYIRKGLELIGAADAAEDFAEGFMECSYPES
jgi:hypothetical protein